MPEYNTPPINTSVALTQGDARATTYFKHWLDVIWRRTGSFTDISMTVAGLQAVEYVVGATSTDTSAERVGTSTARIAWDFGTAGQAKVDLVAGSVTYAYIQDVSATDKLLGRSSPGSGDVEEITCTAAGRALLDDANAAAQLTTLGVSAFIQTLVDDADAATARATLGATGAGAVTSGDLTMATNKLLGRSTAGTGAIEEITLGTNLSFTGTTLNATGGGSAAWTEYEVDFGSTPAYDATFTVVDAAVSGTTEVAVVQSGATATGRAAGDALFDSITYAAVPAAGQFTLYALATPGPVVGKRKILYQVGM
jgi:hypothetical protein